MPFKKSQVNTNQAIYNSQQDLYQPRYTLPEVTITGNTPRIQPKRQKPYWVTSRTSQLNFGDVVKGINTVTLGGLNNLSPTQWARRFYDTLSLVSGDTSWKDYTTNWMLGNNGIVSNKFAKEHPYWSMAINGAGDIAALGGISNASKIDKAIKYFPRAGKVTLNVAKTNSNPLNLRNYGFLKDSKFYSDLDNYGIKNIMMDREKGTYPLTFAERRNYITNLKSDIQKGVDYAINEAKENVTTPLKGEYVESPLGFKFNLKKSKDIQPQKIQFGTRQSTVKRSDKKTPWEGDYGAFRNSKGLFFPFRDRPNTLRTHSMFQDVGERIGTGAHETRHTVQSYFNTPLVEIRKDLPGTYGRYTNRKLPLNFREKVNSYINDAGTAGEWEGSLSEMDAELTGWGAQYGIPSKYSQMTPQQKATVYDLFQKRFGGNTDYALPNDVQELFGSSLSKSGNVSQFESIDNSKISEILKGLEQLGYRKQGGMLELLKKGSGIHIKPENKGKFTDYCGGNVTSECIAKGKKSSNPVIRKRATFAQNARKWKHQMGGNLILDDGKQLDRQRYKEWNQLSLGDKFKRRLSIAGDQMKVPSIPRVFGALSALVGGYDPENPDLITGEAPLPSGIGKIPTIIKAGKTAKLTSGERALDKKIYSQIQRTIDKNARSMEAKDARMVNSGQNSIHKKQNNYDWETMKKYSEYNPAINRIEFKLTKYQKGSQGYKNAQEQKKNLIEQYRAKYRKQFGGNINFLQQGGFLQKVGNFLNSNTGKSIINGITGLAQTYSQNKQLQAEGAAQKALNEADYYKTLQEITSKNQEEQAQQYMNWVQAYQQGLTQDKPSDIVQSYIGNQQLNRKISNLKNDLNIQNKTINSMISKQTSNNWLNTFGGLVNTGIGLLSNNTSIKE